MTEKTPGWFDELNKDEKLELMRNFEVADEGLFCCVFMCCDEAHVRLEAAVRIADQDRLRHYAVNDADAGVRSVAATRLTDNVLLHSLARNDVDARVREAAASAITDRALLLDLASPHPDSRIRRSAILAMKDDSDLMKIVFSDEEENTLRQLAAERVRDQDCLKQIVSSGAELSAMDKGNPPVTSGDIRRAAVLRLRNRELLRAIASDYSERIRVRIAAVSGLGKDDQDILERIAAKPFDPDPRTDADLYYDPDLKAAAVSRLTDELRLRGYLHDEDFETRIAALLALNDQEILKKAAENTDWPIEIRLKAIKQIKDQKYLAGFAMNHECTNSDETRLAAFAASRVYAAKNLAEIAMGSDDPEVSEAAAGRLHSDEWILKIIREIKDHTDKWASSVDEDRQYVYEQEIMMTAADNIEDPDLLVMPLLDDPGEYYGMNNFKEHGIELLCRSERMLRYVKMEKDDRALRMAAKCSMDESVLGALAAGKDREAAAIASRKLGYIGRIGEIGLKKKDEKVRLWQDILERSSFTGVRMLSEYAEGDNLTLARLWLLWLHHSGTMLSVHVKDGEPYESWNRSEDIAEKALQNSIDRVMRDHAWTASEMAELRAFDSECEKGAYRESEIEALLPDVFQEIYDAAVLEEIAVQAVKSIDYVRFKILSLVDARREEAEEPYCGSVPPEGLDEFEYIDWKITH